MTYCFIVYIRFGCIWIRSQLMQLISNTSIVSSLQVKEFTRTTGSLSYLTAIIQSEVFIGLHNTSGNIWEHRTWNNIISSLIGE